jgi:hypothetical protein
MGRQSKEKEFVKWLVTQIKKYGLVSKQQVINSGAMVLDISPVTTARYLSKLTSAYGEFMVIRYGYVATRDLPSSLVRDYIEARLSLEQVSEIQKEIASRKKKGIWAEV